MAKPDPTLGIAESLGPLIVPRTPERSNTQTPKRSDVQTPKRFDATTPRRVDAQTLERSSVEWPETAWSQHPDFSKKTLYLHTETMTRAFRQYEDMHRGKKVTESMLVQMLLEGFIGGRRG